MMRSLTLLALISLASPASAKGTPVKLGPIRAQLFYKNSGKLSPDVLSLANKFVFWNTIIGEGDAAEPADDMVVSVGVTSAGTGVGETREANLKDPIKIVAVDEKGKVLGSRIFGNVFINSAGVSILPMWLRDSTCWRKITVIASYKEQHSRAVLQMACGE